MPHFTDLDALAGAIRDGWLDLVPDLQTFGGDAPPWWPLGSHVWSWDRDRALISTPEGGFTIVTRLSLARQKAEGALAWAAEDARMCRLTLREAEARLRAAQERVRELDKPLTPVRKGTP